MLLACALEAVEKPGAGVLGTIRGKCESDCHTEWLTVAAVAAPTK